MRKIFSASLCRNGVLGGALLANEQGVTYKTGKVTVSPRFRNLEMRFEEMKGISLGRMFIFPTVTFSMKNGEEFRYIVFSRGSFLETLRQLGAGSLLPE